MENDDEDDLDEDIQVSLAVHNIFEAILRLFVTYGNFRDAWEFPTKLNVLFPFGQSASVRSEKMGAEFQLGIYRSQFFLESCLRHPRHIKNMGDEFWAHFITLKTLGQFEFLENAVPSLDDATKAIKRLNNAKSSIFQLIRNYILLELYEGESADLGSMEIRWPVTAPWEVIIKDGLSAFSRLYRINYMLYRCEYLLGKSRTRLKPST